MYKIVVTGDKDGFGVHAQDYSINLDDPEPTIHADGQTITLGEEEYRIRVFGAQDELLATYDWDGKAQPDEDENEARGRENECDSSSDRKKVLNKTDVRGRELRLWDDVYAWIVDGDEDEGRWYRGQVRLIGGIVMVNLYDTHTTVAKDLSSLRSRRILYRGNMPSLPDGWEDVISPAELEEFAQRDESLSSAIERRLDVLEDTKVIEPGDEIEIRLDALDLGWQVAKVDELGQHLIVQPYIVPAYYAYLDELDEDQIRPVVME